MPYHDPFASTEPAPGSTQPPAAAGTFGPAQSSPEAFGAAQSAGTFGPVQSSPEAFGAAQSSGAFGPAPFPQAPAVPVGETPFPAGAPTTSPFPESRGRSGAITVNRPPVAILAACAVIGVGAALAAWLSGLVAVAFGCWALAGPVAMGLLALFQQRDAVAQSRGVYERPSWVTPAFYAGVLVCLLAVCVCAFRIAIWAGRL